MSIKNVKHEFGYIGDHFVSFVEKEIPKERMEFLKNLLEYNGLKTYVEEIKTEDGKVLYNLGVDDTTFNPVIWIYERRLRTPEGRIVNEDYWNQKETKFEPQYYLRYKKLNNPQ